MAREKEGKKKTDKTPALKTAKEKKADKITKRLGKDSVSKDND